MKRISVLLLALCLMALSLPALAGEDSSVQGQDTSVPEGLLPMDEEMLIDLDGDGAPEAVSWTMSSVDEYTRQLVLTVTPEGGEALACPLDIEWLYSVRALDLDGDGATELLISGDVMSDDYCTWCLRYVDGRLVEVLFPDGDRGRNTGGYFKCGYGKITAVDGNRLTLSGSQDMLGTWFATRTVTLTPYFRFEFDDDGLWRRDGTYQSDDDLWEYAALTTITELPYMGEDGSAGVLAPGTKLLITATDKQERAWFTTRDGVSGSLAVSENYEQGWGSLVDGVPEEACFERLPYAD